MVVKTNAVTLKCGCRLNFWWDNGLSEQEWQRKQELLAMGDLRILDVDGDEVTGQKAVDLLVGAGLSQDEAAYRVNLRGEQLANDAKENEGNANAERIYFTPDQATGLKILPPYHPDWVTNGVLKAKETRCWSHKKEDGATLFKRLVG